MDKDKLFSLFSNLPPGSDVESDLKDDLWFISNFEETPMYFLGMFKKIIWNQKSFELKLKEFKKLFPKSNIIDDAEHGEFITFTRAWYYINQFDFENPQAKDAIRIFSDEYMKTACELSISFWEEKEEYEKCAQIKKILDSVNLNLEK